MNRTNLQVTSELHSLATLVDQRPHWRFNVPIYQRLYVWSERQVQTLLNDLINAFERCEPIFYLGGVLMVEQSTYASDETEPALTFDLIDGQQRFTTLWMLCYTWKHALEPFLAIPGSGDIREPRLHFAIRPEANELLDAWANDNADYVMPEATGLERMGKAAKLMTQVFSARAESKSASDWHALTRFVFEQVRFVVTTVPRETDLNKLFEVVNNRGVQLQHHEILKARMLHLLDERERPAFATLWDACADMDNYCERNLATLSDIPAYEIHAYYASGKLYDASAMREEIARVTGKSEDDRALSLEDILGGKADDLDDEAPSVEDDDPMSRVRSIIGFPLLLQHVLRIFLAEYQRDLPRVLDRELLSLFEAHFFGQEPNAAIVREFIDLLWKVRVLFDFNVVKWVDGGDEEVLLLGNVTTSTSVNKGTRRNYINRSADTDAHRGLTMLQSMLYHSQEITTHYWLTPFLWFMSKNLKAEHEDYFDFLAHLDNQLFCSGAEDTLVERTGRFIQNPTRVRPLVYRDVLTQALGVDFPHYWFYKVEFVLWYQHGQQSDQPNRFRDFRLTAKNSVEHISPQTPRKQDSNRVNAMLNRFGNLALVSRSINSEYGNLPFNEKRQRFLNNNQTRLDSLKMALIYAHETWNDGLAQDHETIVLRHVDSYVSACNWRSKAQSYTLL